MNNIALYSRVSTRDKQDPETQLMPLREYAKARNAVASTYLDVGVSGSKSSRPQLDALMDDARRGKIDVVVVARFDRFARSVSHLIRALEEFRSLGIDFVSLNEAIDTSTPMGKMVFTIIGAVAELERSLIIERVFAGLDRARKEGKKLGPKLKVFDREAVKEYRQTHSLRKTAAEFEISRETVRRLCQKQKPTSAMVSTPATTVS